MVDINLYRNDCRLVLDDIKRDLQSQGKKYIMVSDPPFNIGYHYNEYHDKMSDGDYRQMLHGIFGYNQCSVVIHYPEQLYQLAVDIDRPPAKVVSWVYNSNNRKQHRDIAFFGITPDFKQVLQPYKNPNDKRIKRLIANGSQGTPIYDWWNINIVKNTSKEKTKHPCQMPLQVMKNIIGLLPDDYVIIDPFMGSGTTGVAAVELGRDFIGIELNVDYFNIAVDRINTAKEQLITQEEAQ
jgi:hypothetical protein|nr:MAG TPA: adenine-specific methyltransferase [Caudoviricetes sp.]